MKTYTATITHHSISRARKIAVSDNLTVAKRQATAEFGGEFIGHKIVIYGDRGEWLAAKTIGNGTKWANY